MTAQILQSELQNLIQESKRKNPDVKNAAEKSLEELKSLPATSETQFAADLSRRANFPLPFIIACSTRNAKLSAIAVVCLQRLIVARCLPKSRLREVLDALREATAQGLDVQLKILQALPSLLHNYADQLNGELLGAALAVCSILQGNKNNIVSSTSAATFQQLAVSIYDKTVTEDRQKPQFLRLGSLSQTFGLELIESILTHHAEIFLSHKEQAYLLRNRAMPLLIKLLSEKQNFPVTVRVCRILNIVLQKHVDILSSQCEIAFGLLTHMLDPEAAAPWKRALCMEIFRSLYAAPGLLRRIYSLFDMGEGKKLVVRENVAAFVRIATEKPAVIGLGQHSTTPAGTSASKDTSGEHAAMDGVGGMIGGMVSATETVSAGISTELSTVRVACLEQLDKPEPPSLPESYIYGLVLACIGSFSENLARFILPLTIPHEVRGKKKGRALTANEQLPLEASGPDGDLQINGQTQAEGYSRRSSQGSQIALNPLNLDAHPQFSEVKICAAMIEACWPAYLATCSTFLNAALDTEFYHGLVRSFQRFAHVAGLLRLSTPRDAFLTTLGKAAVPPNVFSMMTPSTPTTPITEQPNPYSDTKSLLSVDTVLSSGSTTTETRRQPQTSPRASLLNTRNLLCLRALLNLGIALGPTLGNAWSILFETFHQAEYIINIAGKGSTRQGFVPNQIGDQAAREGSASSNDNYGAEVAAVHSAANRLFESTADFPDESFLNVLSALTKQLDDIKRLPDDDGDDQTGKIISSPTSSLAPRKSSQSHRRISSISGVSALPTSQLRDDQFALTKLGILATINTPRLAGNDSSATGWDLLVEVLISVAWNREMSAPMRNKAAGVFYGAIRAVAAFTAAWSDVSSEGAHDRLLDALRTGLVPLAKHGGERLPATRNTDVEIHRMALDTLKSILEQSTEALVKAWDTVFDIIDTIFERPVASSDATYRSNLLTANRTRSPKLLRPAFNSIQLICSDYLSILPSACILILLDTLSQFTFQPDDLNISLTTLTMFWNISDHFQNGSGFSALDDGMFTSGDNAALMHATGESRVNAALWIALLQRLKMATTDNRSEVRNGAAQTLFRTFDAYGEHLDAIGWELCLSHLIFRMFEDLASQLEESSEEDQSTSEDGIRSWIETTIIALNGVAGLLTDYLGVVSQGSGFAQLWEGLLRYFNRCLMFKRTDLNAAVFICLKKILSSVAASSGVKEDSFDMTWMLWTQGHPFNAKEDSAQPNNNTQKALISYAGVFKELYRLIESRITKTHVSEALNTLLGAVTQPDSSGFAMDADSLSPLQAEVLHDLKIIRTDIPGVPSILIRTVADLVALPFRTGPPEAGKRKQTFIALSKACVVFLESLVLKNLPDEEVIPGGSYRAALDALAIPIDLKYSYNIAHKNPKLWTVATGTSVAILKPALPLFTAGSTPDREKQRLWKRTAKIASSVARADVAVLADDKQASVASDEEYDIASFQELRSLIIPGLGAGLIPDNVRRTYAESLFHISLIHTPHPKDLPQGDAEVLVHLFEPRMGRTYDPPPVRRSKMSYVCLDELFALVARNDGSSERIRLAQAASPFLILRIGITLRAYIADQPLRGLMPQPLTQRVELLHLLRCTLSLDCEPRAIPDAPGVSSQTKKHLHRLFPLISQATRVAARDPEVLEELGKLLDAVGDEMGVA